MTRFVVPAVVLAGLCLTAAAADPAPPAGFTAVFNGKGGCTNCHQVYGKGTAVGPDLSNEASNTAEAIRTAILEPNQAVALPRGRRRGTKFRTSSTIIAEAKDGRTVTGVMRSIRSGSCSRTAPRFRSHFRISSSRDWAGGSTFASARIRSKISSVLVSTRPASSTRR